MESSIEAHFLLVTFPVQGNVNPVLQFAKRLARAGSRVTFSTTVHAIRRIVQSSITVPGLSYASFSDGSDRGWNPEDGVDEYMKRFAEVGPLYFADLIRNLAAEGRPVSCIVYNLLVPWAAGVARDAGLPSVLLWVQPASVLAIYYHYYNGYEPAIAKLAQNEAAGGPGGSIELPGISVPLSLRDLPSFFSPSNHYSQVFSNIMTLFRYIEGENLVLVNTFDDLEPHALGSLRSLRMVGVGPLIPSAFLDGVDSSDNAYGGDLTEKKEIDGCLKWLDSKPMRSVVYVSFGSISELPERQMDEVYKGLMESRRPFLWVIRRTPAKGCFPTGEHGLIVPWCSQVEVLSHGSVGCFVSHCGWNSTSESMAAGVPMVCFPQWTDQLTNAKLVEDVWGTGVRVKMNGEGVLESAELGRCLEVVMGGEKIQRNAERWKVAARAAAAVGGSSEKNIRAFVEEMSRDCRHAEAGVESEPK